MVKKSYRSWAGFSLKDFKNFYKENYNGMGRCNVLEKDSGFYMTVWAKELLDKVFPEGRHGKFSNFYLRDFQDYYHKNLFGMSRFAVFEEDNSFYHAVRKTKFFDKILPKDKRGKIRRKNKELDSYSLRDFRDYYKKHYTGMSRSEVSKEDGGFYNKLNKREFLDKVFSSKRKRCPKKSLELTINK